MISVILSLCLGLFFQGYVDAGSYFNDEFGTASFNVPFGSGHLNVWEHTRVNGRYYVSPITALLPDTASCYDNSLTGKSELRFDLVMWSLEARESVYRHIRAHVNASVSIEDIAPIPMERIRLIWRDADRPLHGAYRLSQSWRTNTRLPSQVTFLILCESQSTCHKFKNIMRNRPEILDGLELQYVVEAQRSSRRTVRVQGRHVMQGQLITRLKNQLKPGLKQVYINSDDMKKVISETVSSVVASVITDADFETEDDFSVKDAIFNLLSQNKVSSDQFSAIMWNSTFWDPVNTRPDVVTRELNELFSKDDHDSDNLKVNEISRSSDSSMRAKLAGWGVSADVAGESKESMESKVSIRDVLSKLEERSDKVEWNGEKFVIKPMDLYRMNIGTLNTTTTIAVGSVQIRKYEKINHIRVNIRPSRNHTTTLTVQLVQSRMEEELSVLRNWVKNQNDMMNATMQTLADKFDQRMQSLILSMKQGFEAGQTGEWKQTGIIKDIAFNAGIIYRNPYGTSYIRLFNGEKNSTLYSGRVHIFHNGEVGTICDDGWDDNDARVICRMLGYHGRAVSKKDAYFGPGSGKILLDNVNCKGSEADIDQCSHQNWGVHDCYHSEDAGVICYK